MTIWQSLYSLEIIYLNLLKVDKVDAYFHFLFSSVILRDERFSLSDAPLRSGMTSNKT